jgi:hypothetical protein
METFINNALHPIEFWRTTDSTVVWLGGFVVAGLAAIGAAWAAWSFVSGLFAQASQVAGI